ncbi:MAG: type II toxin-antitoxin system PemK/MazF family toxin [Candidatus Delongbacteria bacterium]|nr:type II toxin-antitoxin system PemK/MazF family toxin [Candidatus Delongbacteria bacterium]
MPKISRFQIWLVQLNPTKDKEIRKTRPCVIISPDEMHPLATVIVAPMTTKGFDYPFRIKLRFQGKNGRILLDQVRAVDKARLVNKLGTLSRPKQLEVCTCLQEMFAD